MSGPRASRMNLEGRTFGRWTVGKYIMGGKYQCVCTCGTERAVDGNRMLSGDSASCGCAPKNAPKTQTKPVYRKEEKYE